MMKVIKVMCFYAAISLLTIAKAQHNQHYTPPTDSLVQQKLEWWGDIKFGLLMHWGTYSQWGIVESWSLCPEDEDWCKRRGPFAKDYFAYRKAYENLKNTFNPSQFDPTKWAKAANNAGMRYVVFTTKHHDGFCMFDTQETDYKVTSDECPFSTNPKANITLEIFNAFRNEGMGIGAYFSKPDWHCPDYWDPYFPPFDRNPNYDITKYPEKWENYKQFTYNQIKELMSEYGKIDILWLDGGWVQPMTPTSPRWGKVPCNQDIDMAGIVSMARSYQAGLIVVDRAVEGEFQNYLTPEQQLPDSTLPYPWETCMTMASSWSYVQNDAYKPSRQLIHLLCTIVSRGGNFLLNIAPGPNGDWDSTAYQRLADIGDWMKVNSEAIYETNPVEPYACGKVVFTQNNNRIFAIYLADENETKMPPSLSITNIKPPKNCIIRILGRDKPLKWQYANNGIQIFIPIQLQKNPPCKYAWVFELSYQP